MEFDGRLDLERVDEAVRRDRPRVRQPWHDSAIALLGDHRIEVLPRNVGLRHVTEVVGVEAGGFAIGAVDDRPSADRLAGRTRRRCRAGPAAGEHECRRERGYQESMTDISVNGHHWLVSRAHWRRVAQASSPTGYDSATMPQQGSSR